MIENLQDELCRIENKKVKGAKLRANIIWEVEGEKCSQIFLKVLEIQNLQNQTISGLYNDDNKSKYSRNPKDIFKSPNKFYEALYTKEATSKAVTTEFLTKVPNRKKIFNEQFKLWLNLTFR